MTFKNCLRNPEGALETTVAKEAKLTVGGREFHTLTFDIVLAVKKLLRFVFHIAAGICMSFCLSAWAFLEKKSSNPQTQQESVRPRWPYDMRPSVRAEKYIRDASG